MTPQHYQSATELLHRLATGTLSCEQLMLDTLTRIKECNNKVNAIVALGDYEELLHAARNSDERRRNNADIGVLEGIPLTIKDTWEAVGFACTAGATALVNHRPEHHADVVQRLTDAGAIVIGKSNVPTYAGDIQTYNKLFGTTTNPYDKNHTAGGSSGGAAAALAAGLVSLEVGSDLAGSIRTPAHFCGVFGHKPSRGIVSFRGHVPGPPGTISQPDLAEGGPLARTAEDLELLLKTIAGPRKQEARSWKLVMEPSSLTDLRQARIGTWLSDSLCPIENELSEGYQNLCRKLEQSGAMVTEASHPLLNLVHIMPAYYNLLGSLMSMSLKPAQRRQMLWITRLEPYLRRFMLLPVGIAEYGKGVNQPIHQWINWHETVEKMRTQIETLFTEHDVLLTPVSPTAAFRHDHSQPVFKRKIMINGKPHAYMDQFCWIALATLLGLPATSVPIGKTAAGLPYSIQVIGAPGKDLTTLRFAQLLEQNGLAGFQAPKEF